MKYLVTGCHGFIGSHFTIAALTEGNEVIGISRNSNIKNAIRLSSYNNPRFTLVYKDIAKDDLAEVLQDTDVIVNFAAKTFVDHSIRNPEPFLESNVIGTYRLLEEVRRSKNNPLYIQVSTDEVYGAILEGKYKEDARLNPTNPYSATKAAADMLVTSYHNTFGLRTIITRTENNYGRLQGKEKVIPTFVRCALNNIRLPVFGDGKHIRMWLRVEDHVSAILHLVKHGQSGEIYHVAGEEELQNIELARRVLNILEIENWEDHIVYIPDSDARPGHDRRYALDVTKLKSLGWSPYFTLDTGLRDAVNWYKENTWWFD